MDLICMIELSKAYNGKIRLKRLVGSEMLIFLYISAKTHSWKVDHISMGLENI